MTDPKLLKKIVATGVAVAGLSGGMLAQAACPSVPTASRYSINTAGNEVTDNKTGLIWQRCSAGQSWSGNTCTGSHSGFTHEAALAYAKTQNTADSPTGWRLPHVKELVSLADKGCLSPAIDSSAFPATPLSTWYWTSSPHARLNAAWLVSFDHGGVSYNLRHYGYAVRLVRASQ